MPLLIWVLGLLPLLVLSPRMEGTPFLIEGTPAFREATLQAWEMVPPSLRVYVRSARVIRQVDDPGSPVYDCWPWEQEADLCNKGADLGERAIRVTRSMWLGDRRRYTGRLVHEGWHLYSDQNRQLGDGDGFAPGGMAGEAMAIGLQVAALRQMGYSSEAVRTLEAAVGVHGR